MKSRKLLKKYHNVIKGFSYLENPLVWVNNLINDALRSNFFGNKLSNSAPKQLFYFHGYPGPVAVKYLFRLSLHAGH